MVQIWLLELSGNHPPPPLGPNIIITKKQNWTQILNENQIEFFKKVIILFPFQTFKVSFFFVMFSFFKCIVSFNFILFVFFKHIVQVLVIFKFFFFVQALMWFSYAPYINFKQGLNYQQGKLSIEDVHGCFAHCLGH